MQPIMEATGNPRRDTRSLLCVDIFHAKKQNTYIWLGPPAFAETRVAFLSLGWVPVRRHVDDHVEFIPGLSVYFYLCMYVR